MTTAMTHAQNRKHIIDNILGSYIMTQPENSGPHYLSDIDNLKNAQFFEKVIKYYFANYWKFPSGFDELKKAFPQVFERPYDTHLVADCIIEIEKRFGRWDYTVKQFLPPLISKKAN